MVTAVFIIVGGYFIQKQVAYGLPGMTRLEFIAKIQDVEELVSGERFKVEAIGPVKNPSLFDIEAHNQSVFIEL